MFNLESRSLSLQAQGRKYQNIHCKSNLDTNIHLQRKKNESLFFRFWLIIQQQYSTSVIRLSTDKSFASISLLFAY